MTHNSRRESFQTFELPLGSSPPSQNGYAGHLWDAGVSSISTSLHHWWPLSSEFTLSYVHRHCLHDDLCVFLRLSLGRNDKENFQPWVQLLTLELVDSVNTCQLTHWKTGGGAHLWPWASLLRKLFSANFSVWLTGPSQSGQCTSLFSLLLYACVIFSQTGQLLLPWYSINLPVFPRPAPSTWTTLLLSSFNCCCSITQTCLNLCDIMDCSMPGFPVLHYLLEFAQTHVHWVDDAIPLSHPLSPPSPAVLNLSQHQDLLQGVGSSHQVAKVLELQHQSFQWIFRVDVL